MGNRSGLCMIVNGNLSAISLLNAINWQLVIGNRLRITINHHSSYLIVCFDHFVMICIVLLLNEIDIYRNFDASLFDF